MPGVKGLTLTRRPGESITIKTEEDEEILVTVASRTGNHIRLVVDASPDVKIWRTEIMERMEAERLYDEHNRREAARKQRIAESQRLKEDPLYA